MKLLTVFFRDDEDEDEVKRLKQGLFGDTPSFLVTYKERRFDEEISLNNTGLNVVFSEELCKGIGVTSLSSLCVKDGCALIGFRGAQRVFERPFSLEKIRMKRVIEKALGTCCVSRVTSSKKKTVSIDGGVGIETNINPKGLSVLENDDVPHNYFVPRVRYRLVFEDGEGVVELVVNPSFSRRKIIKKKSDDEDLLGLFLEQCRRSTYDFFVPMKGEDTSRYSEVLRRSENSYDSETNSVFVGDTVVFCEDTSVLEKMMLLRQPFSVAKNPLSSLKSFMSRYESPSLSEDVKEKTERKKKDILRGVDGVKGGLVLEPEKGVHEDIHIFDYSSLYPSIIQAFNISEDTYLGTTDMLFKEKIKEFDVSKKDCVFVESNDELHVFRQDVDGVLKRVLDCLSTYRERAERSMSRNPYLARGKTVKLLMNSLYGLLYARRSDFYNPVLANIVTSQGRKLLRDVTTSIAEKNGYKVVYGDTDSVFLDIGLETGREAQRKLNQDLQLILPEHAKQYFDLDFEKRLRPFYINKKKRYFGFYNNELYVKGYESEKKDTPQSMKSILRDLYEARLEGKDVEEEYKKACKRLRTHNRKDFKINKKLGKHSEEYSTVPEHVKVLRENKEVRERGETVSYYYTKNGLCLSLEDEELDYEKYIKKYLDKTKEELHEEK